MGAPIGDTADIEAYDANFRKWQKRNPGKRFSDFAEQQIVRHLSLGRTHASLGANLNSGKDWREDGEKPFKALQDFYAGSFDGAEIPRDFVVCDYGCGTLRVGWHLMHYLDRAKYCGLDLSDALIDFGRQECEDLIAEKKPVIGPINDWISTVADMNVDLVFAFNVACHVHPEEFDEFVANIKSICAKSGSVAILHFLTHDGDFSGPLRYQRSGWAWPLEQAIDALKPLKVVRKIFFGDLQKGPHALSSYYLVLRRD